METLNTNPYSKIQTAFITLLGISWSVLAYNKGPVFSIDLMNIYSPWADILIKHNFNIFDYINNSEGINIPLLSFFWVLTIALNKLLFGANWGVGIMVLHVLSWVLIATILLKITWATTKKPACSIFTGLALVLCYDLHQWIPIIIGDILFTTICFSVFALILSIYQQPSKTKKRFVGSMVLLGIALFFRPAGPPLLMFAIFSLSLVFFFDMGAANIIKRHNFIRRIALSLCLLLPAIILFQSYLMLHPEKWPLPILKGWISLIGHNYRQGMIIFGRIETYHFPPGDILDYSLMTLHKIAAYFYISVKAFSSIHTLINYVFFLPVYALSFFAIAQLFKKENGPSSSIWWAIFLCVTYISMVAFFISLNMVDFDFRYRVPCIPILILLATLGLNELINKFCKKPGEFVRAHD